jgi:hypothetical protein
MTARHFIRSDAAGRELIFRDVRIPVESIYSVRVVSSVGRHFVEVQLRRPELSSVALVECGTYVEAVALKVEIQAEL